MLTIALDKNNDWTFFKTKKDIYEIEQSLNTRLLSIKNDCFFDLEAGIDFDNFGFNQLDKIINNIKDIIIQTTGITKILKLEHNLDTTTRKLTIIYTVETIYKNQTITNNVIL